MPSRSVLEEILRRNAGRDRERLSRKLEVMRASPFAFFRGTAHLFYGYNEQLRPLADAPAVWSTGDLHLENFGCYKGDNRLAYFDLNDFDDAALGPVTWDLTRLLTSLHLGLATLHPRARKRQALSDFLLTEYAAVLESGKPRWIERATAEGPIRRLLRRAKLRTRRDLLAERTDWSAGRARHRLRLLPGRTVRASAKEHKAVRKAIEPLHLAGVDPQFFRVLDVSRRVAGIASLGLTRYVVLVEGRGSPNNNYLLDVKGATRSALAEASPAPQPRWRDEGERVVTVQHWMQAVSPALLASVKIGPVVCTVKELQPTEDRLILADWEGGTRARETLLRGVAQVTAWGHLRAAGRQDAASVDELIRFARRRSWRAAVLRAAAKAAARVESDWAAYTASLPGKGMHL